MLFSQVEEYREINWYTADWVILSSRISCSYNFFFSIPLRHTFATLLVMDGVSIYKIQKFLGHKSVGMTERYLKYDLKMAQVNMEQIDTFG